VTQKKYVPGLLSKNSVLSSRKPISAGAILVLNPLPDFRNNMDQFLKQIVPVNLQITNFNKKGK
jgi:hypothetical protein